MYSKYESLMMTNNNLNNIIPDNYQKFYDNNVFDKARENIREKKNINKKNINITDKDDKLFWIFYDLCYKNSFLELDKNFKREKEIKIQSIKKLLEFKDILKSYKLKILDLENEFLNENKITLKGFFALCLINGINIFYIWDNKYIQVLSNKDNEIIYLRNDKNKEYEILSKDKADLLVNNYFLVENIDKWIKSISSYTKNELLSISNRLNLALNNNKQTKEIIYDAICKKINIM